MPFDVMLMLRASVTTAEPRSFVRGRDDDVAAGPVPIGSLGGCSLTARRIGMGIGSEVLPTSLGSSSPDAMAGNGAEMVFTKKRDTLLTCGMKTLKADMDNAKTTWHRCKKL